MNNKKHIIAALLENIETQRAESAKYREDRNQAMFALNERLMATLSELAKVRAENDELLQGMEGQYKEYIEDTTSAISGEARVWFNQLFNIKESLNGLRSTENECKLFDRIQQVLEYIHENEFGNFFHRNKGLLFDILAKVQPGCVIQPNDSK